MWQYNTETILTLPGIKAEVMSPVITPTASSELNIMASEARNYYAQVAAIPVQTHSLNVGVIEKGEMKEDFNGRFSDTDALISFNPQIKVGVLTADCVPIVVSAPDIKAVAAIHAGWKGTLGGIIDNTLDILIDRGADPAKMVVAFGPSVSGKVYEVDPDLGKRFEEAGFEECVTYPEKPPHPEQSPDLITHIPRPHIDLQQVNVTRLLRRGVPMANIQLSESCTLSSCDQNGRPKYPSYRRDATPLRLMTFIYSK